MLSVKPFWYKTRYDRGPVVMITEDERCAEQTRRLRQQRRVEERKQLEEAYAISERANKYIEATITEEDRLSRFTPYARFRLRLYDIFSWSYRPFVWMYAQIAIPYLRHKEAKRIQLIINKAKKQ